MRSAFVRSVILVVGLASPALGQTPNTSQRVLGPVTARLANVPPRVSLPLIPPTQFLGARADSVHARAHTAAVVWGSVLGAAAGFAAGGYLGTRANCPDYCAGPRTSAVNRSFIAGTIVGALAGGGLGRWIANRK
jgi:hypothetical protein